VGCHPEVTEEANGASESLQGDIMPDGIKGELVQAELAGRFEGAHAELSGEHKRSVMLGFVSGALPRAAASARTNASFPGSLCVHARSRAWVGDATGVLHPARQGDTPRRAT
jgi:hypothetical protein